MYFRKIVAQKQSFIIGCGKSQGRNVYVKEELNQENFILVSYLSNDTDNIRRKNNLRKKSILHEGASDRNLLLVDVENNIDNNGRNSRVNFQNTD